MHVALNFASDLGATVPEEDQEPEKKDWGHDSQARLRKGRTFVCRCSDDQTSDNYFVPILGSLVNINKHHKTSLRHLAALNSNSPGGSDESLGRESQWTQVRERH